MEVSQELKDKYILIDIERTIGIEKENCALSYHATTLYVALGLLLQAVDAAAVLFAPQLLETWQYKHAKKIFSESKNIRVLPNFPEAKVAAEEFDLWLRYYRKTVKPPND